MAADNAAHEPDHKAVNWEPSMKDLSPQTIDLESEKLQFLKDMTAKYGLADVGKAVRCLVNYARENPDRLDDIFGEIRCLDC
jgi:hypothetical protein